MNRLGCCAFLAMAALAVWGATAPAAAGTVPVGSVAELEKAVAQAEPGDTILLAAGTYHVRRRMEIRKGGLPGLPITLRASELGAARIEVQSSSLFKVFKPYWTFENLDIVGVCSVHDACEHAFQVVAEAGNLVFGNNRMRDFNAMIKGNGETAYRPAPTVPAGVLYPADVLIEGNFFYNTTRRQTENPVTFVDVVGGHDWVLRQNLIADFSKGEVSPLPAYGAFFKGSSQGGVMEGNLVICEWRHGGGARVGLSLGGGGTGSKYCQVEDCPFEHRNGIIRNNVIANCSQEVGIYLNKAEDSRIYNNTLYNTFGIMVQFAPTTAHVANNVITGSIMTRRDAMIAANDNLILGNDLAPMIPGLARRLVFELDNLRRRYPGMMPHLSPLVGAWRGFSDHTWLGNGTVALDAVFLDPANGDFTPVDVSRLRDHGSIIRDVDKDFCGAPRRTPPHDLGAMEFDGPRCDPGSLLARVEQLERLPVPPSRP